MYAPGRPTAFPDHPVTPARRRHRRRGRRRWSPRIHARSRAVSDDAPFFWHFSSFGDVLRHIFEPLDVFNPEDVIGERVLLLLLGIAVVVRGDLPARCRSSFVRRQWSALPAKRISAVYFAALGLGFMFFEITMIQRLTRFLGYPTYSLTVTLASILVSTGLGALLSQRFVHRADRTMPVLLAALAALTVFYQFGLDPLTDSLLSTSLAMRVVVSLVVLAPLGLCLGMFMPLGLGSRREPHRSGGAVRRVGVGGERVLLRHRLRADDDPVDDVRLPSRAVRGARHLRDRGVRLLRASRYTRAGSGTEHRARPRRAAHARA